MLCRSPVSVRDYPLEMAMLCLSCTNLKSQLLRLSCLLSYTGLQYKGCLCDGWAEMGDSLGSWDTRNFKASLSSNTNYGTVLTAKRKGQGPGAPQCSTWQCLGTLPKIHILASECHWHWVSKDQAVWPDSGQGLSEWRCSCGWASSHLLLGSKWKFISGLLPGNALLVEVLWEVTHWWKKALTQWWNYSSCWRVEWKEHWALSPHPYCIYLCIDNLYSPFQPSRSVLQSVCIWDASTRNTH